MTWLAPWAFAAGILLAGPVLVHMLLRRNARRVLFPATHLLTATRAAAVRFRRPSDAGLLALRLLIVAAAVAAAARPLFLTPWRMSQWDARTSRAVVVDTSPSMPRPDVADGLAKQEMATAFHAQRFAGANLRETLNHAVRWIAETPPSRREIVVISDFQRGSLDASAIAAIPASTGVRLVRAGTQPPERTVTLPGVAGWRGAVWQPAMAIDRDSTQATWTRQRDVEPPSWLIPIAAPGDEGAADRAFRAAASFGVAPGDPSRRVAVIFKGGRFDGRGPQPVRARWMAPAVLALRESRLLRETDIEVTTGESDGVLVVQAPVAAAATSAAAVLRAVILAVRPPTVADGEAETVTLADVEIAGWARPAAPVTGRVGRAVDEGDARWFWIAAVMLLLLEGWIRRTNGGRAREERDVVHADAA